MVSIRTFGVSPKFISWQFAGVPGARNLIIEAPELSSSHGVKNPRTACPLESPGTTRSKSKHSVAATDSAPYVNHVGPNFTAGHFSFSKPLL